MNSLRRWYIDMNYKKGDQVVIRDDLIENIWYGSVQVTAQLYNERTRRCVTIAGVYPHLNCYTIEENRLIYNDDIILGRVGEVNIQPVSGKVVVMKDKQIADLSNEIDRLTAILVKKDGQIDADQKIINNILRKNGLLIQDIDQKNKTINLLMSIIERYLQ